MATSLGCRARVNRLRRRRDSPAPGVKDAELGALYRGALFMVYPSLIEGWGLPVQESLLHGVPCIAANAGAIPEAGLDLAAYVDPADETQLMVAIERCIFDPAALEQAGSRIDETLADRAQLPSWRDAAETIRDTVDRARDRR